MAADAATLLLFLRTGILILKKFPKRDREKVTKLLVKANVRIVILISKFRVKGFIFGGYFNSPTKLS